MATITKLPSGKYRAQIRHKGIYRARTFLRNLVHELEAKGAALRVLEPEIDTSRPEGRIILTTLAKSCCRFRGQHVKRA